MPLADILPPGLTHLPLCRTLASVSNNNIAVQLIRASWQNSPTTAVQEAVRERLNRIRHEQGIDLAKRLSAIGRDCAAHLKEPYRTIDHAEMFYNELGLPK